MKRVRAIRHFIGGISMRNGEERTIDDRMAAELKTLGFATIIGDVPDKKPKAKAARE